MPLALKPAAVEEDRGHAAQQAALLHAGHVLEQRLDAQPDLLGRVDVRLGDDGQVALRRAHDGDVELVVRDLRVGRGRDDLDLRGEVLRAALHVEVHADLEELERRELADRRRAGLLGEDVERALQAELGVLLDGDREPHVEVVVAQVVVADAGVRVDGLRGAPRVLGVDLGGDEHRAVAERPRVVDRRDLADDPVLEQQLHALEDDALVDAGLARHGGVRARLERELALHQVQQLLVELVERARGAVLA
jgi:hypothetical protein